MSSLLSAMSCDEIRIRMSHVVKDEIEMKGIAKNME